MTIEKPSHSEEEYFAREDALKKQKLVLELQKMLQEQERAALKTLHLNHCPKCGMDLQKIQFRGVELDRCFGCGGHWLDHGELDKIASPEHGAIMQSVLNWFKK